MEEGEPSREAVERELLEELGLVVLAHECVGRVSVPDTSYVLDVWRVDRVSGDLVLKRDEVAAARWLRPHGIRALEPILPSSFGVLELLGV